MLGENQVHSAVQYGWVAPQDRVPVVAQVRHCSTIDDLDPLTISYMTLATDS